MEIAYLRVRSSGVSLESFGASLGLASCWVREGREVYGRSCVVALHSYEKCREGQVSDDQRDAMTGHISFQAFLT